MSLAQTLTAGKLLQAAAMKNDEAILLQLQGRDCVAVEARYHNKCYKAYTKFLYKAKDTSEETINLYSKAFEVFCNEVIDAKIIKQQEILLLSHLHRRFSFYMKSLENVENSSINSYRLRQRIQKSYPQNVFHPSRTRRRGTLVYSETVTTGFVADENDAVDHLSTAEENTEGEDSQLDGPSNNRPTNSIKEMYYTALELRDVIKGYQTNLSWPPDSHELSFDNAKAAIPVKLFNFFCWMLNLSDDPVSDNPVNVSSDKQRKVISLIQDLVSLASSGRIITHKALSLAVTVRQITGSTRLVEIIHGFGHCCSKSVLYKHDSALAMSICNEEVFVPSNISDNIPSTLVWDNNDFSEETLSSKGTTHVANGIIIQECRQRTWCYL